MKILLAVDGSENSLRAARQALRLSKLNPDITVTALYVGPSCYDLFPEPGICAWIQQKELDQEIEARAEKVFAAVQEIFAGEGQPLTTAVERGDTAEAICRVAGEGGFDLVVVGSRGYGDLKGIFLGSVSHKLLHLCSCPVLIVK
ncbi:universal stress protein [Desulfofundulus thermobenzoicus]|uniref:Universal stress protein n=1 Tax=Desulfofundulus thermobenzoicus TaxID=29376 RepID=A0A6N7IRS8_9FIRM|nr:universal stress protein [Desulfofundulus thermobenzoicus]MQL52835.1 universal stress protein [Desulfofundulus thermobenzoicus]HHW43205.1 universal stress protein [Desulfotomaculum sp.]